MTIKPMLKTNNTLYYFNEQKQKILGINPNLSGDCTSLSGDCSNLRGNCTDLSGNCSGLYDNINDCEITKEDRDKGIEIKSLIG